MKLKNAKDLDWNEPKLAQMQHLIICQRKCSLIHVTHIILICQCWCHATSWQFEQTEEVCASAWCKPHAMAWIPIWSCSSKPIWGVWIENSYHTNCTSTSLLASIVDHHRLQLLRRSTTDLPRFGVCSHPVSEDNTGQSDTSTCNRASNFKHLEEHKSCKVHWMYKV